MTAHQITPRQHSSNIVAEDSIRSFLFTTSNHDNNYSKKITTVQGHASSLPSVQKRGILKMSTSDTRSNSTHDDDDNSDNEGSFAEDSTSNDNDYHHSIDGSTVAGGSESGSSERNAEYYKKQLAKHDTKAIFHLKLLVLLILIFATIGIAYVCYRYTKQGEISEFESQFDAASEKIITSFYNIINRIGTISSIGFISINNYNNNQQFSGVEEDENNNLQQNNMNQWPFITFTQFQQRAESVKILSGATYLSIIPIIYDEDRITWEKYSYFASSQWIREGLEYQKKVGLNQLALNKNKNNSQQQQNSMIEQYEVISNNNNNNNTNSSTTDPFQFVDRDQGRISIYFNDPKGVYFLDYGPGPYLPHWQSSPVLLNEGVNENLLRNTKLYKHLTQCIYQKSAIISPFISAPAGSIYDNNTTTAYFATLNSFLQKNETLYLGDPMSRVYIPIYSPSTTNTNDVDEGMEVSAIIMAIIDWKQYFKNILPRSMEGIHIVLHNSCNNNESYTYEIQGSNVIPIGYGDHHNTIFNHMRQSTNLFGIHNISDGTEFGLRLNQSSCYYAIDVYPSQEFYNSYISATPFAITFSVTFVFIFTILIFIIYDRLVERRQRTILSQAAVSASIVSSLYPKSIQDRLMANDDNNKNNNSMAKKLNSSGFWKPSRLHDSGLENGMSSHHQTAIADLYPCCTVFFSDISGFTAWSSTREPEQVFTLLQAVYQAFDNVAKRRKVFKVETIGDSYVAVTGLPDPQPEHAVIMVKFAYICRKKFNTLAKQLERTLGPDTGELSCRFGLHSGSVTAGLLRGDKARFQLFGDTVNTASRMESTGVPNQIQISKSTADLLIKSGKEFWIKPRKDLVQAKGKGMLQTYWIEGNIRDYCSSHGSSHMDDEDDDDLSPQQEADIKKNRAVEWMVEIFMERIKILTAKRKASGIKLPAASSKPLKYNPPVGVSRLDELNESIALIEYSNHDDSINGIGNQMDHMIVLSQLRDLISNIAAMYKNNPFHNFEHACHVTMSVNKLLKRIESTSEHAHDFLDVINSDALAHLGIIFSALIHDVDHRGVSNGQLQKEEKEMAMLYKNKSIAEQNSLDIAWSLLMSDRFNSLRRYMFTSEEELLRFRQVIVTVVLATDIFDKELNDLRKARWFNAFECSTGNSKSNDDLKSTIVIEYIIQASDVSHTMQHWHVFCKWNKRLFTEMYLAFCEGRMEKDPTTFWFNGELSFFDNYVIPLAKKLKQSGVFGASSDEFLSYAESNRDEWKEKGQEFVNGMIEEIVPEIRNQLGLDD